ncbi:TPM domain-containing protein [Flavobacteriaceae bacterium]|nr:TPM domain-containing protein [Flavobacteriaceae bacterium]
MFISVLANAQYNIPIKPTVQTSVYDYSNLLSAQEASSLEQKLIRYSDSTSTQIVVAIIDSTEGEYINYLATNWAQEWGIGDAKKDNGIFILLAKNDRKINISTGYGVEHLLTDKMCSRIIQESIIPFFKKNDYYGGLDAGSTQVFKVLTGEFKATPQAHQKGIKFETVLFLIFIFIIIIIVSKSKKNKGNNSGGDHRTTSLLDIILLSSLGRGSFGGNSSSGGSFGSGGFGGGFGGGGFGGGGASGSW